jgi:lactate dehydrogenase-like 2-hydroxyacid dehydrogenase
MPECVLVTEPEYRKGEEVFATAQDIELLCIGVDAQLLADAILARGIRAVIIGHNRYLGPLYAALGRTGGSAGSLLARFGVGHDGLDKAQARAHGIVVTNTPGTLDASVAEHVFWLLGNLVKQVTRLDGGVRAGQFTGHTGLELCGKTLGLLGFGGIARHVARIAHFGFGMHVLACGRRNGEQLERDEGRTIAEILARYGVAEYGTDPDRVFRESDVVSVHLPAQADTLRFVDARRLALLKPTAWLVNTSRGSVVDEAALYDALRSRRITGAGLDVFQAEPYVPVAADKDLRQLDNVVLTPHVGSNTREANRRMAEASLANVRAFLAGHLEELTRVDT